MERRSLRIGAIMAALALAVTAAAYIRIKNSPDVKYVPTPENVVAEMLKLAEVGADDVVYDLGSGDGRIPIAAVRDFGARRGVGIDIDAALVGEANENARKAGVAEKTEFVRGDLFQHDFSEATVLTMYLLPEINLRLRPKILQMKPGTRVVSHNFTMGDWQPEATRAVKAADGKTHHIYLWRVPDKKSAAPSK
jgi:SAM-dependent methyltransferase